MELRIDRPGARLLVEYHAQAIGHDDIDRFVSAIHAMLEAGGYFQADQTFRYGWSTMRLVPTDADSSRLAFEELDGTGVPDQWTRGVSRTLIATRLQRDVCDSFSLPAELVDFPSFAHDSIVCDELDPEGALRLHRLAPLADHDSGWFFACQHPGHDHDDARTLAHDSLYVHACRFQAVLPFLALPIGSSVLLAEDGVVQEAYGPGDVALAVAPGTYLAARRGRTSRI
jgi:hypothetical protein